MYLDCAPISDRYVVPYKHLVKLNPEGNRRRPTGKVTRIGELGQVLDSNHADDRHANTQSGQRFSQKGRRDLQESKGEDGHQRYLLLPGHSQLGNLAHGKPNDKDVQRYVQARSDQDNNVRVDTFRRVFAVPVQPRPSDGIALQGQRKSEGDAYCNHNHNTPYDPSSENPVREEAEIEAQDRYLDETKACSIQQLIIIVHLLKSVGTSLEGRRSAYIEQLRQVGKRNRPDVLAQSKVCH